MVLIRNLGLFQTGMPGLKLPTFYLSFGAEPQGLGTGSRTLISGPPFRGTAKSLRRLIS
jgi:hypothetical protein